MQRRWGLVIVSLALAGAVVYQAPWRLAEARDGRRLVSTGQALAVDVGAMVLPARGLDLALSADGKTAYAEDHCFGT